MRSSRQGEPRLTLPPPRPPAPCAPAQAAQSFARRDLLLKLQGDSQQKWQEANLFEADAPAEGEVLLLCRGRAAGLLLRRAGA